MKVSHRIAGRWMNQSSSTTNCSFLIEAVQFRFISSRLQETSAEQEQRNGLTISFDNDVSPKFAIFQDRAIFDLY